MKANAPERIYIDDPTGEFDDHWSIYQNNDSIEYTYTDAFIEKAIKFFTPYIQDNSGGYDRANVIENFRNYIKGE